MADWDDEEFVPQLPPGAKGPSAVAENWEDEVDQVGSCVPRGSGGRRGGRQFT